MTTPIATVRTAIYDLLRTNVDGPNNFYAFFPRHGVKSNSVVIQNIGGIDEDHSVGQQYNSTNTARVYRLRLQIDVYADEQEDASNWADQVLDVIWSNRATLNTDNNITDYKITYVFDKHEEETYEKMCRRSMGIDFIVAILSD